MSENLFQKISRALDRVVETLTTPARPGAVLSEPPPVEAPTPEAAPSPSPVEQTFIESQQALERFNVFRQGQGMEPIPTEPAEIRGDTAFFRTDSGEEFALISDQKRAAMARESAAVREEVREEAEAPLESLPEPPKRAIHLPPSPPLSLPPGYAPLEDEGGPPLDRDRAEKMEGRVDKLAEELSGTSVDESSASMRRSESLVRTLEQLFKDTVADNQRLDNLQRMVMLGRSSLSNLYI